jgi:ribosomal protein S18 acetylase RimI-like enzyme
MSLVAVIKGGSDLDAVHDLFLEYAESLSFNTCFGGFDQELTTLPGDYVPPGGCLLLAREGADVAGCVAVRPVDEETCEMRRLYVRPHLRGAGLGRELAAAAIAHARALGYRRICLETLPAMPEARSLYASLGFTRCAPYYDNSRVGSDCFALELTPVTRDQDQRGFKKSVKREND